VSRTTNQGNDKASINDEASVEDEALTDLEDAQVQASLRTGISRQKENLRQSMLEDTFLANLVRFPRLL
jgi:hypothetical protein